jgi:hypothetical protein
MNDEVKVKTYREVVTDIKAVRLTKDNLDAVAKWVDNGVVFGEVGGLPTGVAFIGRSNGHKVDYEAYLGEWIVFDPKVKFRSYSNETFRDRFVDYALTIDVGALHEIIAEIVNNPFVCSCYRDRHDMDRFTKYTVKKVLNLLRISGIAEKS